MSKKSTRRGEMMRLLRIEDCSECSYNYGSNSFYGSFCLHTEGKDEELSDDSFPEWCPLPITGEENK